MKALVLVAAISLICCHAFGQKQLPVIKARSKTAVIIEGEESQSWYINPRIRPDIHVITKNIKPKWVTFRTDIDSIKVKLTPGSHFDFVVLLNNSDSCYTRLESAPVKNYRNQEPAVHDTIPFILTAFNNIKIEAILNKADTLNLMFDSGTTGLLLTNDAIKNKAHSVNNTSTGNALKIGNLYWDKLQVYPVELTGQGLDGRFGWDLFDGKIVEIDYDKSIFIVHAKLPGISKNWTKLNMEYVHTLFCIRAELQIKNRKYESRFLFDNGYQRTAMLDTLLMKEQGYPKNVDVIKKVIMKNGQGKEIPVITVNNERLNLGREVLRNIPVQLLATANPARFKTHILGNEVLKRFNTILDFQNNVVYLKSNSLVNVPYKDAN
ncbi:MAG: hypothetical protein ACXVI9_00270 [Mucilaginibacter sp.]